MIDFTKLSPILIEASSFISAFAAIAAAIIMARFLKKFVTGILATGFKTIGFGIFIVALAIIIDAVSIYIQVSSNSPTLNILLFIRQILFVIGTYIIVIGSKSMGEKLEALSKHKSA
ncbi:MAG: hypothetical protein HYW62_01765 [Candidatus Levybacteria bacterium]|nr:hypothetical protein [Candidatus Levybacteria bacterium]